MTKAAAAAAINDCYGEKPSICLDPTKRHDFLFLVDCANGNPNGDPDADNRPRQDPETLKGYMTDGCHKRKLRNYVEIAKEWESPYRIYVQNRNFALNDLNKEAYEALKMKPGGAKIKREDEDKVRQWMCENYWDIRMFGAAMSTKPTAGIVWGPMQITKPTTIDPITILPLTITRVAVTRAEDLHKSGDDEEGGGEGKRNEMGRSYMIPYGLYLGTGSFSTALAKRTGVTQDDLALFWDAMLSAYEQDRSAARGTMTVRGIYIFSHDNERGNAPAHKLLEKVTITRKPGVEFPRSFRDYEVNLDTTLPAGVTLTILGD